MPYSLSPFMIFHRLYKLPVRKHECFFLSRLIFIVTGNLNEKETLIGSFVFLLSSTLKYFKMNPQYKTNPLW